VQVTKIIPEPLHSAQQNGATTDDVWKFIKSVKERSLEGDQGVPILDAEARSSLVNSFMQNLAPVRCFTRCISGTMLRLSLVYKQEKQSNRRHWR
jgi:hypothetical protein